MVCFGRGLEIKEFCLGQNSATALITQPHCRAHGAPPDVLQWLEARAAKDRAAAKKPASSWGWFG